MRLKKGSIIVPFEKILSLLETDYIKEIIDVIIYLLREGSSLYVLTEPVVAKTRIKKEKYIISLAINSLIIPPEETILKYDGLADFFWILEEDVWAETLTLSINEKKIYVSGFKYTRIPDLFKDIVYRIELSNQGQSYISLNKYPLLNIKLREPIETNLRIVLLRPGHMVVNGLKSIAYISNAKISVYKISIDDIIREPVDVLVLNADLPLILESLKDRTLIVLSNNLGKYLRRIEDLITYNAILYMLTI